MEMGASHVQVMSRASGKAWKFIRFGEGSGASSLGGVDVMPTLVALREEAGSIVFKYGRAALDVRIAERDKGWTSVTHLKLAFLGAAPTNEIKQTLASQQEKVEAYNLTVKDLAKQFFEFVLKETVEKDPGTPIIYTNISDVWANAVAQQLLQSLQDIVPNGEVFGVDECLSSLVGVISKETALERGSGEYLVIDCGHSTMNLARARVRTTEPRFALRDHHSYPLGAGIINVAVENEVRAMNQESGEKDREKGVEEVSRYIDEYFKPEAKRDLAPLIGFNVDQWQRIMEAATSANATLDDERVAKVEQQLKAAAKGKSVTVLVTGRAGWSKTFRGKLETRIDEEFPDALLRHSEPTTGTAVLGGLQRIADDWGTITLHEAPMSLWLRSDPDDGSKDPQAVRFCRHGQELNPTSQEGGDRNPSHAMHFELSCSAQGRPEIDLSVFGTPTSLSDEDVIEHSDGTSRKKKRSGLQERLVFALIARLTRFGDFSHEILIESPVPDTIYHVYVFAMVTRIGMNLFAVFAKDGHKISGLEERSYATVIENGMLLERWKVHRGVEVLMTRLGQIARPEFLVGRHGSPLAETVQTPIPKTTVASSKRPRAGSLANVHGTNKSRRQAAKKDTVV
ncbi:hypothetical protein LTS12_027515 [Elasticomyces elasticus]|nr:hypothetical protein LTS12_027515 [Elasticomyces elasticus]